MIIGAESCIAVWIPIAAFVTPGPRVTKHSPGLPVSLPQAEAMKAAQGSVVKEKLSHETALAVGGTAKEFDAFIRAEQARWKPVIERAQIKPEGMG